MAQKKVFSTIIEYDIEDESNEEFNEPTPLKLPDFTTLRIFTKINRDLRYMDVRNPNLISNRLLSSIFCMLHTLIPDL